MVVSERAARAFSLAIERDTSGKLPRPISLRLPSTLTRAIQEREPEVVPEEEQPRDRRAEYVRNALLTLAAVLALGLLALTVRALLGRRRLRQAAARYQDPDCRMGCGYILCAVHDLLGQPGLPEDPLSPEDAEDLVYLEREVWYSGHTMTEDQRRRCLALLESTRRVWQEQTPALRRFVSRFITCKVF